MWRVRDVIREKLFEMFNHSLLSSSARSKWMTGPHSDALAIYV